MTSLADLSWLDFDRDWNQNNDVVFPRKKEMASLVRQFGNYRSRCISQCMIFNCPRVISLRIDNHRTILISMKRY